MSGMDPKDLHGLTGVADPRVSPDGERVAYVVWEIDREANTYRSTVWLASVDGAAPPRAITSGTKRDGTPRWSPDGRWLAFTSDREGDHAQLYVMPVDGPGEASKLTDLKESVGQLSWAPDGSAIAFSARVPDEASQETDDAKRRPRRISRLWYKLDGEGWTIDRPRHLFVASVDGSGEPRQLTHGDHEDSAPAWSPGGAHIAFISARHTDWDLTTVNDLFLVPSEGGEPERITHTDAYLDAPAWSPDGTRLALHLTQDQFDEPRHGQIAVIDVDSRERTMLTASLDRNCAPYPPLREPAWDGADRILFALEDRGTVPVFAVAAQGGSPPEPVVAATASCVTGYDVAVGVVVHSRTDPTSFSELFIGDRRVTDVGSRFLVDHPPLAPEEFTAVSPDGTEVQAWIMRPAGLAPGERVPTVLNIHGGPFTQYGQRFFDEFQVYAGAGYAVLFANPRGSSGYSEEFGRAIRGPVAGGAGWGGVDAEDLMAVVDEAIERFDVVDPERLGVMGGSYGGFMTSWLVGHSDRFRCAISERAVNDMASEDGTADFAGFFRGYVGATFWDAPEAYANISPLTYAKNITTPLLIMHSEDDLRCPIGQAEELFTVLRWLKRDVELVRFPAEGHELTRAAAPRIARCDSRSCCRSWTST